MTLSRVVLPQNFIFRGANNNNIIFFGLNGSTLVKTETVRPGGGEKTLRSSRLPPPNHLLSKTLNERAH